MIKYNKINQDSCYRKGFLMKILLATDAYDHFTNGVSVVVTTLEESFRAMGHDVRVLTVSADRSSHCKNGVYYMPSVSVPVYPNFRCSFVFRHPYLDRLIRWKPDVVHIHSEGSASWLGKYIARKSGAGIVMTWHTDYAKFAFHDHNFMGLAPAATKAFMKASYRGARVITVPSYKAKKMLDAFALKCPNTVIPNGIVLDRFKKELSESERAELLKKYGISADRKILVVLSRLSPEKNIGEIIRYFSLLLKEEPKLHLLITGSGPDQKHLEQLSHELGIEDSVTFTGFVLPEETYKYYKLGIAFFSASTFEMHSLTYLEAMASGLPLVCRRDPCLRGVLTDGENGFIYKTKDEFLKKTLRLVRDDELRKTMSQKALAHSERFSREAFAENMLRLYQRVCKKSKPKGR